MVGSGTSSPDLDFVSLSLFSLVVRTGSFSRGAELAHLAVGAASKRISDLEDTVGSAASTRCARWWLQAWALPCCQNQGFTLDFANSEGRARESVIPRRPGARHNGTAEPRT